MTVHAVTAQAAHATLEDLGYQTCTKHGKKPYRWSGRKDCPRCDINPNLIPRHKFELPTPKKERKQQVERHASQRVFSDDEARRMQDLYWNEDWTLVEIAKEYGRHPSTIAGAVTMDKYSHLGPIPQEWKEAKEARKTCSNGHLISRFGRAKTSGRCNECIRLEYSRRGGVKNRDLQNRVQLNNLGSFVDVAMKNGKTHKGIARAVGVGDNTLRGYKGVVGCPIGVAQKLARELGVSLDELKGEG